MPHHAQEWLAPRQPVIVRSNGLLATETWDLRADCEGN